MIFGAITNIIGSVVKGYFETKKEKAKQKLLQVQAETKIMEKKIYWKVLGQGLLTDEFHLLGFTSCKKSYLRESIKDGWEKEQLKFIELKRK